jgi:hypothetical protein
MMTIDKILKQFQEKKAATLEKEKRLDAELKKIGTKMRNLSIGELPFTLVEWLPSREDADDKYCQQTHYVIVSGLGQTMLIYCLDQDYSDGRRLLKSESAEYEKVITYLTKEEF